jgi:hypothetical protein
MLNWHREPGEKILSPYIWVYFAIGVPLTLMVLLVWKLRTRHSRRKLGLNKEALGQLLQEEKPKEV